MTHQQTPAAAVGQPTHRRRAWWRRAIKFLGVVLLVIALRSVDFASLGRAVAGADYTLLSLFLAGALASFVARGVRYRYFLRSQGIELPMTRTLMLHVRSSFWGLVVPGRLGEVYRIAYLAKLGVPLEKGMANLVLERLADVVVICLFCLVGALILWPNMLGYAASATLAAGLALAAGYWTVRLARARLGGFFKRVLKVDIKTLLEEIVRYRAKVFLLSTTALIWLLYAGSFYFMARAFHIPVSLLDVLFFVYASLLIGMVPITFAGIGTRDYLLVTLFGFLGLTPDKAILFSSGFLLVFVAIVAVCTAVIYSPLGRLDASQWTVAMVATPDPVEPV